ncbi:TetR/AcrR family transcriptional regulator [Streptomyces sp. ISL-96]|uniref:TetR/AcrR family transcriptional regulator n=1 Tax=Streptomyces sp. ISL-96 TaxID=2819191 RepID=UPI001BE8A938|nr:TetR/AcrR family transcriptional regulator [Streptomyces sp. ISL-96]MBT2487281.1 TetR/AcrR family transcriptional regulator [Streptomyces sp. ISL-96]
MARPTRYDTSLLLDAAVRLAAEGGPSAVTMAAVAKAVGAPSGSVYHRFPSRTALLAEVWLRTVERFQEGYVAVLTASGGAPREAAVAASRHVVAWSRTNRDEAALLLHGPEAFGKDDWAPEQRDRADAGNRRVFGEIAALGAALGVSHPVEAERIALALIDLPLALVRRHVRGGAGLPAHAEQLAADSTALLLSDLPVSAVRARA